MATGRVEPDRRLQNRNRVLLAAPLVPAYIFIVTHIVHYHNTFINFIILVQYIAEGTVFYPGKRPHPFVSVGQPLSIPRPCSFPILALLPVLPRPTRGLAAFSDPRPALLRTGGPEQRTGRRAAAGPGPGNCPLHMGAGHARMGTNIPLRNRGGCLQDRRDGHRVAPASALPPAAAAVRPVPPKKGATYV